MSGLVKIRAMAGNVNVLSKVLPYALMALIGLAGWSMHSTALLAIVVLGTMGVAIGTGMTQRPQALADMVNDMSTIENAVHDHDQHTASPNS